MTAKPDKPKRRTPTAKVLAALWVIHQLGVDSTQEERAELLTSLYDSKVSPAKADKVLEQYNKLTDKLLTRMQAVVDRFENPPVKSGPKRQPPRKASK